MGLEKFIPPDSEISSKEVLAGMIYHVDTFSVDVLLYDTPQKIRTFSKCAFACPDEDIVAFCEVKVYCWNEKDGTQKSIVELVKDDE